MISKIINYFNNKRLLVVKKKLDDVGPGFCLAPWTNNELHLGTGTTHSCHHVDTHLIPLEEIKIDVSALHNTSHKKNHRKSLLNQERPIDCRYCYKVEDQGTVISDRILMSSKKDSLPYYDQIKNLNWKDNFDPTYLEVIFSNTCNMSCSYCGPSLSSKWYSEALLKGPYPTSTNYNDKIEKMYKEDENPYISAWWEYFPKIYYKLDHLRISGGEPLLNRNTFKLLDYVKENKNKNMNLTINSNLSLDSKIIAEFIEKIKEVQKSKSIKKITIATSGESTSHKAEYIRDGINYSLWLKNCETILSELPDVSFHLMCTYNCLCVSSFTDFLRDLNVLRKKYRKIYLSVTYLTHPNFLEPALLPKRWKDTMYESLKFLEEEIKDREAVYRFKHVISMFETTTPTTQQKKDFFSFIKEYDLRRNKNFDKTFPEYSNLLHDYSKLE